MSDYNPSDHDSRSVRHGRSKDQLALEDLAMQEAHGRSEPYIVPERKSTKVSCASPAKTFKGEVDQMASDTYQTYDAAVVAMKEECYEETAVKEFKMMATELTAHLKKYGKEFTHLKLSPDKTRKEIASYAQIWIKEADKLNGNFHDSDEWGEEILLCVEASLTQVRRIEKVLRTYPEENIAHLKKKLIRMLEEMTNIANAPWEKLESQLEDNQSKDTKSQVESKRSQTSTERRAEYKEHLSRVKLDKKGETSRTQLALAQSQSEEADAIAVKSQAKLKEKEEKKGPLEDKRKEEKVQQEEEKRHSYEYDTETPSEEETKELRSDRKSVAPESEKKQTRESISTAKLLDDSTYKEADYKMQHREYLKNQNRVISVSYSALDEPKPFPRDPIAKHQAEDDTKINRLQSAESRSKVLADKRSQGNIAKNKPLDVNRSQSVISGTKSKQNQEEKMSVSSGKHVQEHRKSQSHLLESKSKQDNAKSQTKVTESRSKQGSRKSSTQIQDERTKRTKQGQENSRSKSDIRSRGGEYDSESTEDHGNEKSRNS